MENTPPTKDRDCPDALSSAYELLTSDVDAGGIGQVCAAARQTGFSDSGQ
jgi:hypothetical protein